MQLLEHASKRQDDKMALPFTWQSQEKGGITPFSPPFIETPKVEPHPNVTKYLFYYSFPPFYSTLLFKLYTHLLCIYNSTHAHLILPFTLITKDMIHSPFCHSVCTKVISCTAVSNYADQCSSIFSSFSR